MTIFLGFIAAVYVGWPALCEVAADILPLWVYAVTGIPLSIAMFALALKHSAALDSLVNRLLAGYLQGVSKVFFREFYKKAEAGFEEEFSMLKKGGLEKWDERSYIKLPSNLSAPCVRGYMDVPYLHTSYRLPFEEEVLELLEQKYKDHFCDEVEGARRGKTP